MKIELERTNLEKEKVVLETKVKQIGEQSEALYNERDSKHQMSCTFLLTEHCIEQELQQLKEKANRDEQTRQEVISIQRC